MMNMIGTPDRNVIGSLNPRAVVGYLRATGWEKKSEYGDNAAVFWARFNEVDSELLVPVASNSRDFRKIMEVMIEDLVGIEDRSYFDIIADLSMAAYDVIRIRSQDSDDIGSVQLRTGIELHEHARDLVLSAANVAASEKPRAVWLGRRSDAVKDYADSLRLAQSQRGSFIISLLSPWEFISPSEREQSNLFFADPFGRRATRALARALAAVGTALRRTATEGVQAPFEAAVSAGVSANLCQALAQLAREGDGTDVSIRWSLTKPDEGEPLLKLSREDSASLVEAVQRLSEYEPIPDVLIEGIIVDLKEEPSAFDGVTTIEAFVDGKPRRVTVEFAKDDVKTRDALIDAFKHHSRISVVGEVIREGRRLKLKSPRGLAVLSPSEVD
jgi:hypothetical protein